MSHKVSNNVCHAVTNNVSHRCPDQTRPDQTVLKSFCGCFGHLSIHRHLSEERAGDAWMTADAAIGGGR